MAVKVVTDSVSDVPSEVAEQLGITIIPLNIHFGEECYRDGIDLTTDQFYHKLMHSKALPTTGLPSLRTIVAILGELSEKTDEIAVITISQKLSGTFEAVQQAIEILKAKCRIEVIDSQWAVIAEGLIVIAAAKAAKAGASLDEVIKITSHNITRVDLRMAFDTLEYLQRGGRIGKAQALLGSMLKVNPILGIKDGEVAPFGRERSRAKAIDYLYNFTLSYSRIEEIAIEDATTPDEAEMLVERLGAIFPPQRIYRSKVSPVIGAHVGPRVLSLAVLGEKV